MPKFMKAIVEAMMDAHTSDDGVFQLLVKMGRLPRACTVRTSPGRLLSCGSSSSRVSGPALLRTCLPSSHSPCNKSRPVLVDEQVGARDQWRWALLSYLARIFPLPSGAFMVLGERRIAHTLPPSSSMASSLGLSGGGARAPSVAKTPTSEAESICSVTPSRQRPPAAV